MAATLGEHLAGAVRELLNAELKELRDLQSQYGAKIEKLEQSVDDLSESSQKSLSQASETLRQELLARLECQVDTLGTQLRQEQAEMERHLRGRLDQHESDTDGLWGLRQLRERVEGVMVDMDRHQKVVAESKTRTDDFNTQLQVFKKQSAETIAHCKQSAERLQVVEEGHVAVGTRQQVIEDKVAQKYHDLWQDVTRALQAADAKWGTHLDSLSDQRKEEKKIAGRNSINYVTQMVAAIHDERRRLAISKDLLSHWREQTWVSQRKRTGLHWLSSALVGIALRRQRTGVTRWAHATSLELLTKNLCDQYDRKLEEYERKLPDVPKLVEDMGLPAQCSKLDQDLEAMRREKCSREDLEEVRSGHSELLSKHAGTLQDVLSSHGEFVREVKSKLEDASSKAASNATGVAEVEKRLLAYRSELSGKLVECEETLARCATSKEVKDLLKDVCHIWSSIKQLDAAKADRKDVDLIGIEKIVSCSEEKASKASLDDLQGELREKYTALDLKLDETKNDCTRWQGMWDKLTSSVEDLVGKVTEMQPLAKDADLTAPPMEVSPVKPGAPPIPTASLSGGRSESRGRPRSASRVRATDIPSLPFRSSSLDRSPSTALKDSMKSSSTVELEPILSTARLSASRLPPCSQFSGVPRTAPQFARPK